MRIVYFLPDVEGGVASVVKNLLHYRPRGTGIQYAVVLFRVDTDSYTSVGDDLEADEIIRFSYSHNENAWSVFKRLSKVLFSDTDLIVANDGFEIKMVTALQLNNPVVYILHGDFDYYYSIVKNYHSVIDHCIAISNKIEKQLRSFTDASFNIRKLYFPFAAGKGAGKTQKIRVSGCYLQGR